ncbi:TetR/AcrR family transcriptional regulator [Bacillus timonensis]|nr:TetR/AcrR family transcriptional regulator [Bacillus timonensis]
MPPIVSDEYKEKKRKEILESALNAFSEKGFQLTTIDDIVSISGMSKGAIYHYFESKEDIYLQLLKMKTDSYISLLEETFQKLSSATEKLDFLFSRYIDANLSEQWQRLIQVHIEFWINSTRHEEIKQYLIQRFNMQYRGFLAEVIKEGISTGEFNEKADPEIISSLFWGIIDGVCLHYSVIGDEYAYREVLQKAKEMIVHYLK